MRWPSLTLRLASGAAVGLGALAAAQFTGIFVISPAQPVKGVVEEIVVGSQDQHGWAMLTLALIGLAALIACLWFQGDDRSEPSPLVQTAALALAVTGLIALLIFLTIDLPDANRIGSLGNETGSFLDARAVPQIGFWLEMVGSLIVFGCGAALAYSSLTGQSRKDPEDA